VVRETRGSRLTGQRYRTESAPSGALFVALVVHRWCLSGSECAANPLYDTNLVLVRVVLHRSEASGDPHSSVVAPAVFAPKCASRVVSVRPRDRRHSGQPLAQPSGRSGHWPVRASSPSPVSGGHGTRTRGYPRDPLADEAVKLLTALSCGTIAAREARPDISRCSVVFPPEEPGPVIGR
jgi:hypothetical protein